MFADLDSEEGTYLRAKTAPSKSNAMINTPHYRPPQAYKFKEKRREAGERGQMECEEWIAEVEMEEVMEI